MRAGGTKDGCAHRETELLFSTTDRRRETFGTVLVLLLLDFSARARLGRCLGYEADTEVGLSVWSLLSSGDRGLDLEEIFFPVLVSLRVRRALRIFQSLVESAIERVRGGLPGLVRGEMKAARTRWVGQDNLRRIQRVRKIWACSPSRTGRHQCPLSVHTRSNTPRPERIESQELR